MQQSPVTKGNSSGMLDVRGIQPPDNILAVLKKAGELSNSATLEFVIESNPFQLYDLLQQRGFVLEMEPQKDGTFVGRVKARDREALGH